MKIAIIGHKRIPSREGGVEIVVEELAKRMVERGHEVHAYNRGSHHVAGSENDIPVTDEYKGIRIITVPTPESKSLNAIVYSVKAAVRVLFGKYDVIHFHAEGPCSMIWLPHLFKMRTVATIHGLDWKRGKWGGFASKFLKFGEKMAAKYADKLIVLSRDVQTYFKQTYNRDAVFIPNGVDIPEIQEADIIKSKYGLTKDSYMLFLARLVPEKGAHYLIEAFRGIDTDKKLVIAGGVSHSGEYGQMLKELAKKDSRVIMTGFVQGNELCELYSNCCLYVLPSDIEGMAISLLEAMSYGCACLTSDIEENKSVTGDFGYTFKKSDVNDLRDKLADLINNSVHTDREAMIAHMKKYHGWDEAVDKTLKTYERDTE